MVEDIVREIVIEEIEKNFQNKPYDRIIIMEKTFKHTEVEARLIKNGKKQILLCRCSFEKIIKFSLFDSNSTT